MPFPLPIPFAEHLGLEFVGWGDGQAEIAVDLREEQCNSWQVAHGGVTMTLLDIAMAHAARSTDAHAGPAAPGVVTIEMKTTFMRPGVGRLRGLGRLLHRTASMAFCEASILDAEGKLVAHATGTFKYLKALPVGGRMVHRNNASD